MSGDYRSRAERKQAAKQAKPKKAKKRKTSSFFKMIALTLVILMMIGVISGIAVFAYFVKGAPPLDETKIKDPLSSTVYDMNGRKIAELGGQKRTYISYSDIPKMLEQAVLATEDARFYQHHGIDFIRLGGAIVANFREGFGAEGGSTITQQVVKLTFLSREKTLKRKVQELWLALRLEQKYSKHEILEMYLNKVYYSNNVYGVAKAAEFYFGKTNLKDLTLPEAALLAGMPQSPNNYNPYEYPEAAKKRRDLVLSLMEKHGFITKEEAEKAKKVTIQSMLVDRKKHNGSSSIPYDSFIDEVIKEVTDQANVNVYEDGLKIYTTLDPDAQSYVEDLLNSNELFTDKKDLQAAIALIDTKTGEIRALGGGRNQDGVTFGFNYATQRVGQPGSTIKPILDYGPAIEYLQWSTAHQLVDEPYQYSNGTPIKNWNGTYEGPMTMRMALARSRNIPALKALQAVGLNRAKQFANKLGMGFDNIYESYAVGGLEKGVSPLQMAGAYSAFGNNGVYIKPHAVTKIVFPDNTEMDLTPKPKVAMKDYTAYMITDMLKSVVQYGTGTLANVPGLHVAGKTGTTNYPEDVARKYGLPSNAVPDSWFVGYTPNYTAAVWTGFSKRSSTANLSVYEQKLPRLLFKKVIAHVDDGGKDFPMPKSVVKLPIKKGSNPPQLAGKYTPKDEIVYECFVRGSEPTETAKDEQPPAPTNIQATYDQIADAISLSWKYGSDIENVAFEVRMKNDKGEVNVLSTTDLSLTISHPTSGALYTFEVYTVSKDGQVKSEPATTTLQVPSSEQSEPQTPTSDQNGNNNSGTPNGTNDSNNNGNNEQNNSGDNSDNNTTPTPPAPNPTNPPAPNNGAGNGSTGTNSTNSLRNATKTNSLKKIGAGSTTLSVP
ncbi:penicillin-binding protein 1A [Anoxybacillus tepidamans]|uniref:Penicillin-binding protein 1A n=1 Tax=Anoxybacteroides tepidamans TaxID=265948 RepID=A0A7W8IMR6_9BACL|nr:PBP1A family penicillin-binding protein [Anoxybacillus tepidamans]MBB5323358.1 penicillin-binding protein 1A [Anoxybacillus tepidamans]